MSDGLHDRALVVDTHVHGAGFVPGWAWRPYRLALRRTMPDDVGFDVLAGAGVDAVVAKAVGDPLVTRLWLRRGWDAVEAQLDLVRRQCAEVGGVVAESAADVRAASRSGRPAVVLGLEGADVVASPDDVDRLHALGVRVVGLVHFADNRLGTICMPWQRFAGDRLPVGRRRSTPGLTPLGAAVLDRLQELGMVVDLAHADRATVLAACERARKPVVSTHTGARALQDGFPRFLSDEELAAIAGTGGVVGLWPFHYGRHGLADVAAFSEQAAYLAGRIGALHVCIGTDMNGVPGTMDGYRDERDFPRLTDALVAAGLSDDDVRGVLGENFLRVWEATAGVS